MKTAKFYSKGFTLVELLIVITIIGILTGIVISVYGNVQKGFRDARRRVEVDSVSKSVESAKDYSAVTYSYFYNSPQFQTDFTSIPQDPNGATSYCYKVDTAVASPPADPVNPDQWTSGCPTTGNTGWVDFSTLSTNPISNAKAWKICAKLEQNTLGIYCKGSLRR